MFLKTVKFILKFVPNSIALLIVKKLVARTQCLPISSIEKEALAKAKRFVYGKKNKNIAYSWGEGPLVIMVHGWSGRASQLAPLALFVSQLGFRCVAFDVTGHGESFGKKTEWTYFFNDISELNRTLNQNVYAYVGHSAGALTMMAARNLKGLTSDRYICISAPSYPFPALKVIQKLLNPRKNVMDNYKKFIAKQFQLPWDKFAAGSPYLNINAPTLLVYDEQDKLVPHSEGDKILNLCGNAKLVKTNSYSHSKILLATELNQAVKEFLT